MQKIMLATIVLLLLAGSSLSPAGARPTGISGVPNGCSCHSASPAEDVQVTLDGVPQSYTAGDEMTLTVAITGGPEVTNVSINQGGFNLVASDGTFSTLDGTTQLMAGEATHTEAGNDQRSWQINWTAPSDNIQDITFTAHGNSVNGDNAASDEDHWNKTVAVSAGVGVIAPPNDETPGFGLLIGLLSLSVVAISLRPRD